MFMGSRLGVLAPACLRRQLAKTGLTVLKWKDIVEAVEQAINAIEGVANLVSSIAVKHA